MITTVLLSLLALDPATIEAHSFRRTNAVEVQALATDGEPLPGVTVKLCPFDGSTLENGLGSDACRVMISEADGRCGYRGVEPGVYILSGELTGFASTAVSPLSIAAEDPIAPDQVFLYLNPVCWHC